MKCDKCGAPVTFREHHPIGLPPTYDMSEIKQLRSELKNKDERIKALEAENKAQKEVIKIDVQVLEAIRNEYPNTKDLQAKIIYREETVEQALKGGN